MSTVVLSVTNDLVTDQRVHRVASTLQKHGYVVHLIGRKLPESMPIERPYRTSRMKLIFIKGPLFYAEFNIRLFFKLLFQPTNILVANDLDTLPANYLASIIRRKPLVFDAHELFTEVPELVTRKKVQAIWKSLEKRLVPNVKYSYTVCDSIAETYYNMYGIKMATVRNLPLRVNSLPENYNPPPLPDQPFVLYQGAINLGRGLELLIESFVHINNISLVIAGDGDILDQLKQQTDKLGISSKVYFLGKLPFQKLKQITPLAALGVSVEEALGLNYYYALPNKIFDYIQSGVPVLVSDLPEMKKVVIAYKVGEIITERKSYILAQQIQNIISKTKTHYSANLAHAASELCWENEENILIAVYNQINV